MKRVLIGILFLLLVSLVSAAPYEPVNYVSDYANAITPEFEAQINELAASIEDNTTVEVAVLTIPSLKGQNIESLAIEVFQDWGIGKKDVNNGLLLVIAVDDRAWRVEVGYGLEPVITDAMAGRFGREILVPNFQAGEYGKGVLEFVQRVHATIKGEPEVVSQSQQLPESGWAMPLLFLFVALTFVVSFATRKLHPKKRWSVRIGVGVTFFVILALMSLIVAVFYLVFFLFALIPKTPHGGFGGFNGGFSGRGLGGSGGLGGGFGGFGGGRSGGGGAG
ncbi:MAG TPA: TPM domain-containing protein, partial [Candidatus Nanoarchaeia archaeon]|nr:TPM domain-containing protein [Candidatus Nanoarchaeia archaeon]